MKTRLQITRVHRYDASVATSIDYCACLTIVHPAFALWLTGEKIPIQKTKPMRKYAATISEEKNRKPLYRSKGGGGPRHNASTQNGTRSKAQATKSTGRSLVLLEADLGHRQHDPPPSAVGRTTASTPCCGVTTAALCST